MSTDMKSKIAYMTKEQFDFITSYIDEYDEPLIFSRFVRQAIEEKMRGGNK
jgi:hypothetical protein